SARTPEEARNAAVISSFSSGTQSIYALFDWAQIAVGTLWGVEWTVDGEPFYQRTLPWSGASTGQNFLMRLTRPGGVPDVTHRMPPFRGRLQSEHTQAGDGIAQLS